MRNCKIEIFSQRFPKDNWELFEKRLICNIFVIIITKLFHVSQKRIIVTAKNCRNTQRDSRKEATIIYTYTVSNKGIVLKLNSGP